MNGAASCYLEGEVKCFLCGHVTGVLRRDVDAPRGSALFVPRGTTAPMLIRSLADLSCARCQGSVFTDEFDLKRASPRVELALDDPDRPRRGRPPKHLVELRRQREQARLSA